MLLWFHLALSPGSVCLCCGRLGQGNRAAAGCSSGKVWSWTMDAGTASVSHLTIV